MGVPIAALKAGQVIALDGQTVHPERSIENALRVGAMPANLRPYYA